MHDIIDTAVAAGSFKTLAAALTAAKLIDTLKGAGPFTVFAPTDEAFAKLPAGTVESLLQDIPKLSAILTYHVVAGAVMASDVMTMDGQSTATVNGATLAISTQDGRQAQRQRNRRDDRHRLHQRRDPRDRHGVDSSLNHTPARAPQAERCELACSPTEKHHE